MKVALFEEREVVAASHGFLESLGLASAGELAARGGLDHLAPGLAAHEGELPQHLTLAVPAGAPAEAEVAVLHAAGRRERMLLLRLAGEAGGAGWPFLAKLSHELRTPLTSIIGFAELMQSEALGPLGGERYRGYVGDILASARHAASLVADLLDLAKIRSGRVGLAPAWIDPCALVGEAAASLAPRADEAGIRLERRCEGEGCELLADARSLRQILLNLVVNALQWTPRGGAVEVAVREAEGGGLLLSVSDTGPGMRPEALDASLADPFASRGTSGAAGSSGLGLPLARELAAANRAILTLSSQPGQGTRAELSFDPSCSRKRSRS